MNFPTSMELTKESRYISYSVLLVSFQKSSCLDIPYPEYFTEWTAKAAIQWPVN